MQFRLSLYISGETARSLAAIRNVRLIVDTELPEGYQLECIDVQKDPERAERDKIMATPTLVREHPAPKKKIIGEFTNHRAVVLALEIDRLQQETRI